MKINISNFTQENGNFGKIFKMSANENQARVAMAVGEFTLVTSKREIRFYCEPGTSTFFPYDDSLVGEVEVQFI